MPEAPPTIPYATPTKKHVDPIVWWFAAGFALLPVGLIALVVVEPEREMDPPASPLGEAVVVSVFMTAFAILLGSTLWFVARELRRRRRVR